jgi:tetratricopeptide (TPR) repeat protein
MWRADLRLCLAALALGLAAPACATGPVLGTVVRQPVLALDSWRGDEALPHKQRETDLLYALSMASAPGRQAARFALARFYLATGDIAEARAVLAVMERADVAVANSAPFAAVRGMAALQAGQLEMASHDLEQARLDGEPQVWLLRAEVRERSGDAPGALDAFDRGRMALGTFGPAHATAIQLAAVRAALTVRQIKTAGDILAQPGKSRRSPSQLAEAAYLSGRTAELAGQPAAATAQYKNAASLGDPRIAAKARFAAIDLDRRRGVIRADQAIDRLEKLRFIWRGDEAEQDILASLGTLQAQAGQWRAALTTLRTATTYMPPTPQTTAIADRMQGIFAGLFGQATGNSLPPLEALALFSDFRELTPLGADGDRMIRQLSNRLIDIGLPERAAGLLEHQVRHRLTGTPQATVAVRLALVDLMANQPAQAVDILRLTKKNQMPNDVRTLHAQVEARALVQLNLLASALDCLDGDRSRTASLLRADVHWRGHQWAALQHDLESVFAISPAKLTVTDQRLIMRWAYARTLQNSAGGPAALARRFGPQMAQTKFAGAFRLLTTRPQTSTADINRIAPVLADIDTLTDLTPLYRFDPGSPAADRQQQAVLGPKLLSRG